MHPLDLPTPKGERAGVFIHQLLSVIGWAAPGKHSFMGSKMTYRPEKSSSKEMQVLEVRSQAHVHWIGKDEGTWAGHQQHLL